MGDVKQMPGTEPQKSMRDLVKIVKDDLPAMIEMGIIRAQLCRSAYLALVKEGFSKAEAMELAPKIAY